MFVRVLFLVALGGCQKPDTTPTGETSGTGETGTEVTLVDVAFSVDDRANATYDVDDGLAWKASFSWDAATNQIMHDDAWQGPFPPLYDDGATEDGGHEPAGAVVGDHLWGVVVQHEIPAADVAFDYGAIRGSVDGSDGEWIWIGANGSFVIPAGATAPIVAPPLVIPAFGTIDLRLTIDVSDSGANLAPPFQGTVYSEVGVKGSRWAWREVPLRDDGAGGDATAVDGIYTFVLSASLGEHEGLLELDSVATFVFVLNGVEYKAGADQTTWGVTAASDASAPGAGACVLGSADCVGEVLAVNGVSETEVVVGPN